MSYKKSVYNIEIKKLHNGDMLIYNSYTSAFGVMDKNTQIMYEDLNNIDKYQSLDKDMQILEQNGFIVNSDRDEVKEIILQARKCRYKESDSVLSLTIAPTLNCNMRCPYCYENKKDICMSEETQELIIKFIQNKINSIKQLDICWYGGEPLMELNIIRSLSKKIISICADNNIEYFSSMISNGTLLTKEVANILKTECNISRVQTTIDGTKEINNSRRKLIDGRDSFTIINNNIKDAAEYLDIVVRVNVDKSNTKNMDELLEHLCTNLPKNIMYYFSPVVDNGCNSKDGNCLNNKEFKEVSLDLLNKIYSKGETNYLKNSYPISMRMSCSATTHNCFVIDPNGKLYKCWNEIGQDKYCVGDVEDGENYNERFLSWLTVDIEDKCLSCELLPLCQGGCPYSILENKKANCSPRINNYKEQLALLYEALTKEENVD